MIDFGNLVQLKAPFGFQFKMKMFEDFNKIVAISPTYVAFLVKSTSFYMKVSQIEALIDEIEKSFGHDQMTQKFKQCLLTVDKVIKLLLAIAFIGCSFMVLVLFATHELPLRMWFPFTYESNVYMLWIAAFHQMLSSFYYAGIDVVLDSLPFIFTVYIYEMLD
jgi:7tm Odorant receptor